MSLPYPEEINADDGSETKEVTVVTREKWDARPSREIKFLQTPVDFLFIHHTSMSPCNDVSSGCREMRVIQNFHMDDREWADIGYSFLIDEGGHIYEGRGWDRVGAHTLSWNDVAVAFSVMGDFSTSLPSEAAINSIKNLIKYGIDNGKLSPNFKLYGHRDVRDTACPGQAFYDFIKTWPNFGPPNPTKPVRKL